MVFFQDRWDIAREDVIKVFHELYVFDKSEKSLNATFITLISKWVRAADVKDFHHISFINEVYKMISKVLANRLSNIMGMIASKSHNAFVKGRKVLNFVVIANECLTIELNRVNRVFYVSLI